MPKQPIRWFVWAEQFPFKGEAVETLDPIYAHSLGFKNGDKVICTSVLGDWVGDLEHNPYNPGDIAIVNDHGFVIDGVPFVGTMGTWELLGDVDVKEVL